MLKFLRILPTDYPQFWAEGGALAYSLLPFSLLYQGLGFLRGCVVRPLAVSVSVPVVCIGNIAVGGVGKTPILSAIAAYVQQQSINVHILAHGYGGSIKKPTLVNLDQHLAHEVGDEALIHAAVAPTWVGGDRSQLALAAVEAGAELLLMDDGWQNPKLQKDFVLAVVDADDPFGNGFVLPAGPLRQKSAKLADADAVIAIGEGQHKSLQGYDVIFGQKCSFWSSKNQNLSVGDKVYGFSALGKNRQFKEKLKNLCKYFQYNFVGFSAFPDHYQWDEKSLKEIALKSANAYLVTTLKDWLRLPKEWQEKIGVVELSINWSKETEFNDICNKICNLTKN